MFIWPVGLLVCCFLGYLAIWTVGLLSQLVIWEVGYFASWWCVGYLQVGLLIRWFVVQLVFQSADYLASWYVGLLVSYCNKLLWESVRLQCTLVNRPLPLIEKLAVKKPTKSDFK